MAMFRKQEASRTDWYVHAMEHLVVIVQELSHARDLDSIMVIVRTAARELTGADGATFILRDEDKCYYADENAVAPLWKGQRFPMKSCISGWVMIHAEPVIIEDIYKDPRIPIDAYRPTFVKSLAMVPIRKDNPVGAIGNYWAKNRTPSNEEISILQALANVTAVAIENVELYKQLEEKMIALEASNKELARFAWIASHDLKTPLLAIDSLSQRAQEDLGKSANGKTKENIDALRTHVRRMEKLLNDVLEYTSIESKLNKEDLSKATGGMLMKSIPAVITIPDGFTIKFSDNFKSVRVPQLPLQRILSNLIDNAIKHHNQTQGTITIDADDEETHYIFTISDDGPGIPAEHRDRIFETFQTLEPSDSKNGGVGLAIVKKILAYYGGTISVASSRSGGAQFRFIWPKTLDGHTDTYQD